MLLGGSDKIRSRGSLFYKAEGVMILVEELTTSLIGLNIGRGRGYRKDKMFLITK